MPTIPPTPGSRPSRPPAPSCHRASRLPSPGSTAYRLLPASLSCVSRPPIRRRNPSPRGRAARTPRALVATALSDLEETRKSVERELHIVRNRLERVEQLERDKDVLRKDYLGIAPEALDSLTPEERHDFYKLVRLRVVIYPNCDLEISWVGGEGLPFSTSEWYPSVGKVLNPDTDSAIATVLAAAAIAAAVIIVPADTSIVQVGGATNGIKKALSSPWLVLACNNLHLNSTITNPEPFCLCAVRG